MPERKPDPVFSEGMLSGAVDEVQLIHHTGTEDIVPLPDNRIDRLH